MTLWDGPASTFKAEIGGSNPPRATSFSKLADLRRASRKRRPRRLSLHQLCLTKWYAVECDISEA
jgi:hypothetical protein